MKCQEHLAHMNQSIYFGNKLFSHKELKLYFNTDHVHSSIFRQVRIEQIPAPGLSDHTLFCLRLLSKVSSRTYLLCYLSGSYFLTAPEK